MDYHSIATGTASAKKGDTQPFRFAVNQSTPYPTFRETGVEGLETLNPNKYRNHDGAHLSLEYVAFMLSPEYTPENHKGNRCDHAGYKPYGDVPKNPGAFQFRGVDLGELSADITLAGTGRWEGVQWSGGNLTEGARKWLDEQVTPVLLAHVKENAKQLRDCAIDEIERRFKEQGDRVRANLARCEAEAAAIVATLRKG